jgi:hypothetical protein
MTGYRLSLLFNDSYAFRDRPAVDENAYWYEIHQTLTPNMSGASHVGVRRCAKCGELLAKWDEPLTGLKIKKRQYDISCTYDGVDVVSRRFKEVCDVNELDGLKFIPLPDDPDFFQIQATDTVAFDAEKRKTQFINQCNECGRYESVIGATPVFLKENSSVIPDLGFVRTDLEFASGDEKSPVLLCGISAGRILKKANLKGLDLTDIRPRPVQKDRA